MTFKFKDLILYMIDSYKARPYVNKVVIDSFSINKPLNIYVMYHTNRYDINKSIPINDFLKIYSKSLDMRQVQVCSVLASYEKVYSGLTISENTTKEYVYKLAKNEIDSYER